LIAVADRRVDLAIAARWIDALIDAPRLESAESDRLRACFAEPVMIGATKGRTVPYSCLEAA
jgi:hypothetical protein